VILFNDSKVGVPISRFNTSSSISTLSLDFSRNVFQISIAELETQIAHLIGSDQLDARIDSHKKVKRI
jgi:hypothetical protein